MYIAVVIMGGCLFFSFSFCPCSPHSLLIQKCASTIIKIYYHDVIDFYLKHNYYGCCDWM